MIDWNKEIQAYGQGDNSVTDRMWYELACQICIDVETLTERGDGDICGKCIAGYIRCNNRSGDFKEDGERIYNRMLSLGTSFTSRITVEYVRSEIEKLLKTP